MKGTPEAVFPYLIQWGGFHLPSYYFFLFLAFVTAFATALWQSRRLNVDLRYTIDLCLIVYVGAIIGAKLLHAIVEPSDHYTQNWWRILYVWQGGFVFYGGFIGAVIPSVIYVWIAPIRFVDALDIAAPAIPIGLAIGRLGCLSIGCCHGAPTDWSWGITFQNIPGVELLVSYTNRPLHPTQILSSIMGFLLFVVCIVYNRHRPIKGLGFFIFLSAYALFRFLVEFLRGDEIRGVYFDGALSTSQLISIPLFGIGLLGMAFLFYNRKIGTGSPNQ